MSLLELDGVAVVVVGIGVDVGVGVGAKAGGVEIGVEIKPYSPWGDLLMFFTFFL
jgi:hypothetical protein